MGSRSIIHGGTALFLVMFLAASAAGYGRQSPPQQAVQSSTQGESAAEVTNTSGVVRTVEGAPIPGAAVRLTNVDTNQAWASWTDESGKFEFPALPTGRYRVEASQLGFTQDSVEVKLPIVPSGPIPIVLRVATLAELTGQALSATKSASENPATPGRVGNRSGSANAGGARNGNRGGQVPAGVLNAVRQGMASGGFQQTELAGESSASGQEENTTQTSSGQMTAGLSTNPGGASTSDSFLLQGTVGQGLSFNGPGGFPGGGFGDLNVGGPGGRGPGGGGPGGGGQGGPGGGPGQGFGPPSGGFGGAPRGGRLFRQQVNRIRFGISETYENSLWDAKPYSITGAEAPKTAYYNEQIGVNAGGPLKIPHVYNGSDRTFFFTNYQHKTSQSAVDNISTVPTLEERSGNFCNVPGPPIQLYNPYSSMTGTRTALGCNLQADPIALDKAAQGLLAYIPLPNLPTPNQPGTVRNFELLGSTPSKSDFLNLHVLHTINAKFNLNGGYNFNSTRQETLGNFPGFGSHKSGRNQNVDLGLDHNWSPKVVEDIHLNWSRSRNQVLSNDSYGTDIEHKILGMTGVSTAAIDYGVPTIGFTNFTGLSDPLSSLARNQTLRLSDSVMWTHKTHTMRFGGEVRRIELNSESDPDPRGQFTFTGLLTSQLDTTGQAVSGTGNDFADFLLGLPQETAVQFGINPHIYLRSWGFVGYGQDDWRVNKKFTFLYGLRYEAVTPPVELFNHLSTIEFNSGVTQAAVVTPGETGPFSGAAYPNALVRGNHGNLEPRIGFAWQPPIKPKTIVRSGYSIFYNESIYNTLAREFTYQEPWATSQSLLTSATQLLTLENGFPAQTGFLTNTEGVNLNYKTPYAQLWMLGVETDLSKNWVMNLTYTGTKGTNLDLLRIPNRAPLGTPESETQQDRSDPNATGFLYDQSGANSIYNALQVRVVHRFTSGFTLQGIYTFAKSLDNASSIGGGTPVIVQQDGNYAPERGLSSFDVRHQLRVLSTYELPFGERKRLANHGWTEHLFGNWRLMNNLTWQTGIPYTALLGGTASDNGTGTNFSLRAEQVGNPNLGICGGSTSAFFNVSAFSTPPPGQYGNEHRGAIEGPCSFSWNMSFRKSFRFGQTERGRRLDAGWEVHNLTNTPTFNGIGTTVNSQLLGQVTSAGSMRTMDFTMRMNF
jgi:trimeric autotransporter adhesin